MPPSPLIGGPLEVVPLDALFPLAILGCDFLTNIDFPMRLLFELAFASKGSVGLERRGIGIDPFSSQSLPLDSGSSSALFCDPPSTLVMDEDSDAVDDLEEKDETEAEESDILLGDDKDDVTTGGEEDRLDFWIKSESSVLGSPTDQSTSKTAERYELRNWGSSADFGRDVDRLSRDGMFGDETDLGALGIGVGNDMKEWGEGGDDIGGNGG